MKTLKELYWKDINMSKRMEAKANRKGMIYMAKYVDDISGDEYSCKYLSKKLQEQGICQGDLPQRNNVLFEDGSRLIIVHVKENSKMCEALRNIGFEE